MSQVLEYSEKVMDHFSNPRNVGEIENAAGIGTVGNAKKIPAGFIEVHLDVERGGKIEKAKIFGDFFASNPIEEFEEMLIGKNHDFAELDEFFSTIDLTSYFGKVTKAEILSLFK